MNIDDIMAQWQKDCVIDKNNLDETSRQTPALHAKYLQLLSEAKLRYKREEMRQKTLLKDKWLYYNGKMTQEQIEDKGWAYDPLDGLKVMKGDMNYYYDSDKEIQDSELKVQYFKTCIDTLTEIVDSLKWRHQTIGNMIRWRVFESGG
jgi:hypothetical protein